MHKHTYTYMCTYNIYIYIHTNIVLSEGVERERGNIRKHTYIYMYTCNIYIFTHIAYTKREGRERERGNLKKKLHRTAIWMGKWELSFWTLCVSAETIPGVKIKKYKNIVIKNIWCTVLWHWEITCHFCILFPIFNTVTILGYLFEI